MQYEYYRKGFSRIEREVYRAIENGLDKHEPYVSFELISMEQLNKIVKAIEYDRFLSIYSCMARNLRYTYLILTFQNRNICSIF